MELALQGSLFDHAERRRLGNGGRHDDGVAVMDVADRFGGGDALGCVLGVN